MTPEHKRRAKESFQRARDLDREILGAFPRAWQDMDTHRARSSVQWPPWCLLPMGAAAQVASGNPLARRGHTIALMSALYAWRFSRSVWLVEPGLMSRLLTQVPDTITVEDLAGLPEWCIHIASDHPEFPGAGLWAHLEYDVNTSRPELRLLLDLGDELMPIPVYLDRGSTTEALADYRATAAASVGRTGADVRGGELDVPVALLAEAVDGYLGLLAYLARPEADIAHASRPGVRPVKPRKPKRDADVWLVGYSNVPGGARWVAAPRSGR